jgi:hypothetical protein
METLENRLAEKSFNSKHLHKIGKQILESGNNTLTPTRNIIQQINKEKSKRKKGKIIMTHR